MARARIVRISLAALTLCGVMAATVAPSAARWREEDGLSFGRLPPGVVVDGVLVTGYYADYGPTYRDRSYYVHSPAFSPCPGPVWGHARYC